MARWTAAIGFVAGAVIVTACASTGTRSPWWRQTGASACGGLSAFRRMFGGCNSRWAGLDILLEPPPASYGDATSKNVRRRWGFAPS